MNTVLHIAIDNAGNPNYPAITDALKDYPSSNYFGGWIVAGVSEDELGQKLSSILGGNAFCLLKLDAQAITGSYVPESLKTFMTRTLKVA